LKNKVGKILHCWEVSINLYNQRKPEWKYMTEG
jgi:hypothetical protein